MRKSIDLEKIMSALSTLIISDTTVMGKVLHEVKLSFVMKKISLRDIIIERIRYEVDRYNNLGNWCCYGLVQPTEIERKLNQPLKKRSVDFDKQVEAALKGFESNSFFVLIGGKQVDNLSTLVDFTESSNVSFVKLTPLIGG